MFSKLDLIEGSDVYVYLHSSMVCSRYPKECRYYETVLKRKCLRKLKDNVWERKTKWILLEKADNHYQMKLLYKHFNSWIVYLNECFKKKINTRASEVFYEGKLKSKGLNALKKNLEHTRILMRICRRKFVWNLKHKCWHQWKHYTQKRVKVREIKQLADRIREERLRVRCFYLWSFRLREKRSLEYEFRKAEVMHRLKLQEKYFNSWRIYIKKKVCKARIQNLAKNCYEDKLKEKFIEYWRSYTIQKKRYKYHMKVIYKFHESYLIKNYLNRWLSAYEKLKLERKTRKRNLAESFHDRKLLQKSFQILWKIRERRKEEEEKVEKFRELFTRIYLEFYLNLWYEKKRIKMVSDYLENRAKQWREDYLRESFLAKIQKRYEERLEEKEEMANVIKYSNAIMVHRAFRAWLEMTEKKIHKRLNFENADGFYSERLTRKTFDKWKEYRLKKNRKKMAVHYYTNIILSKVLNEWRIFLTEQKMKLARANNLERRINARHVKNAFDCWRNEIKSFLLKWNTAEDFHEKSQLSRAFNTWKKNSRTKALRKSRNSRNRIILNGIIIKNALLRWNEMHSMKLNQRRKLEGFRVKMEKRTMRCHFSAWNEFVEKMKSLWEKVKSYPEIKSSIVIEECLAVSLGALKDKKLLKRKNELAITVQEKILKRKYLRKWLTFVCWKKERLLKSIAEGERNSSEKPLEFCIPFGKTTRRQPIIPEFLKTNLNVDVFEECPTQETFRVEEPVNKKLPMFGHPNAFVFFET